MLGRTKPMHETTSILFVLYNGIRENDDTVLSLSDCFENPEGDIDVVVHVTLLK